MESIGKPLVTICTISLVSGLSVAVVSGWAFFIRIHNLEEFYPNEEAEQANHTVWNQMKVDWKSVKSRDLATLGISVAAGLIQFIIAVILMHNRTQVPSKTLASRYVLSNIVVMLVLLICSLTTLSKASMNTFTLPFDLKKALCLEHAPFEGILVYGINAFNIWIALDFLFLLVSIITVSSISPYERS